ncbi:hypothetical protein [Agromyces subbeticus]|uniref:hypothetical protein n=1 Tax=Agromyces subbeticus TaxID=293890 RepID=UPI0003B6C535|nr:hypothetical protein [Agromyces subbeticus]
MENDSELRRSGGSASEPGASLPFSRVVEELRSILGARLVAYLGGVRETRTVRGWAEEDEAVESASADVVRRLRSAHAAAVLVGERFDRPTTSSWFQGMNPSLGDHAPAWVLLHRPAAEAEAAVIQAAKAFLADG